MIKKILVNTAIASLLVVPASFAGSHNGGSCQGGYSCSQQQDAGDLKSIFQQLDLSFAQKREMRKIKMKAQGDQQEIADELRENFMKLQDYGAGNYNAKAVKKLAQKQGKLFAKRIEMNMKLRDKLFNVLTDEQKAKFKSLIDSN